jgi:hypothetical protein
MVATKSKQWPHRSLYYVWLKPLLHLHCRTLRQCCSSGIVAAASLGRVGLK